MLSWVYKPIGMGGQGMYKKLIFGALLAALVLAVSLVCLAHRAPEEPTALEQIQDSIVVKLECSQTPEAEPIFLYQTITVNINDLDIVPSDEAFVEPWLYRFTYNPPELVHDKDGNSVEIVVLFGAENLSVDGATYTSGEGLPYRKLLNWAETQYQYYADEQEAES